MSRYSDFGLHVRSDQNFGYFADDLGNSVVRNDVFLNNSDLFEDLNYENSVENNIFNDFRKDILIGEDFDYESNGFDRFVDQLCAEESADFMANRSDKLFGCVCCHSCQLKSQQFMIKTNKVMNHFKRQLIELKNSVRQQLSDINTQMNDTRVKFAKLILDLQIKLNKKNFQLEKILDISQVLQQTNDYLLRDNKDIKLKFESVCKENIKFRKNLGIELKIVLNPNDCDNYLKQMQIKKQLVDTTISNTANDVVKNEIKFITIEDNINEKVETKTESKIPPKKALVAITPIKPSLRSQQNAKPLRRSSPQSSPKLLPKALNQSPPKESTIRKTVLLTDFKTYSKISNNFKDNNQLINTNITLNRQQIQSNVGNILKKYQINCNHFNGNTPKKRRIDQSFSDSQSSNHNNNDSKPQQQINRNESQMFKRFSENTDHNK